MSNKQGCTISCFGCLGVIIMFLFLCWFFFMGGCTLIQKKTNEALAEPTPVEKTGF